MPTPDHQHAHEDRAAASAALVDLARLLGQMAAREHLAASAELGDRQDDDEEEQ